MEIGLKIKQLREERGWSQEELAKRMGVANKQTIYRFEHSQNMKALNIEKFAKVFGVSPAYFIDDIPDATQTDEYVELIALYSQLSEEHQKIILQTIKALLNKGE